MGKAAGHHCGPTQSYEKVRKLVGIHEEWKAKFTEENSPLAQKPDQEDIKKLMEKCLQFSEAG
jgi:hypothetical protein